MSEKSLLHQAFRAAWDALGDDFAIDREYSEVWTALQRARVAIDAFRDKRGRRIPNRRHILASAVFGRIFGLKIEEVHPLSQGAGLFVAFASVVEQKPEESADQVSQPQP